MTKSNICCLLLLFLTLGCQKSFDSEQDLLEYISDENNGYKSTKTVNSLTYTLQYRPTDMLVQQDIDSLTSGNIKAAREKYKKYIYFNLSLSKNHEEILSDVSHNREAYSNLLNTLAFNIKDKIHLYTSKKDTIGMIDFIYPRMYGVSKSTTVLLIYPREEKILNTNNLNLVVEDLGMSTGDVKFQIDAKIIDNEPTLKF